MASGKATLTFQLYRGEEHIGTETLRQDIVKVGKLSSSHLRVEDDKVSRMHAVIEVTSPTEVFIIDLGSSAGTIVNGEKVNKVQLQSGDEILFGDTRAVVEIEAAEEEAAAPAPAPVAAAPEPTRPSGASPFAPPTANPFQAPAATPNPFAASAAQPASDADVVYGIQGGGAPVNPAEVETGASAVEVVIMWGDNTILHVEHLSPPRPFTIGGTGSDYLMSAEVLGRDRLPVVVPAGNGAAVIVPEGASGHVTVSEGQSQTWDQLRGEGKLQPSPDLPGAMMYPVPEGATARIELNGIIVQVKATAAGKRVGAGFVLAGLGGILGICIGSSLAAHATLLAIFFFVLPPRSALNLNMLDEESRLVQYMMEPPETPEEETPEWEDEDDEQEGGTGKRHRGDEGEMGDPDEQKTKNRFAIRGPEDNPNPTMARQQQIEMAQNAGAIGALRQFLTNLGPASPDGDVALGNDAFAALGALMGDQPGSNYGAGGLGLRGTGVGGGGTGEGTIGLGNLGTIGHGAGGGSGSGYGRGAGGLGGRRSRVPRIATGTADVRGSLSAEVIRRVVRRHLNEVRFCYEQQLNTRPDLEGRVVINWIISPTGAVQRATVANSTLRDQQVEQCIAQAVRRWTFPAPDGGGVVGVNYPFRLQSSGG